MNIAKLNELILAVERCAKAEQLDPTFAKDRALLWAKIELRNYVIGEIDKQKSDIISYHYIQRIG